MAVISDNQAILPSRCMRWQKPFYWLNYKKSFEKSKHVLTNTKNNTNVPINVHSEQIERFNHFEYLYFGSIVLSDGSTSRAISARISKTRIAMLRLRTTLFLERLTLRSKGLLIEIVLKPVLLLVLETLLIR